MSAAAQQKSQVQVKLSVVKGPHAGQSFQINREKIVLGRGPENDVVLINDPQVSRLHAQIMLVNREFEIFKISQKNAILIDGESVDKWKLVSGSTFTIGDSEIKIEFNLGQPVVSVKPNAQVVQLKAVSGENTVAAAAPQKPRATTQPLVQQQARPMARPSPQQMQQMQLQQKMILQKQMQQQNQQKTQAPSPNAPLNLQSLLENPRARFYAIIAVVLIGLAIFYLSPTKANKAAKSKPVMKYEDEINIKLNSTPEKELVKKREETRLDRNSPQYLRAQENFIRGMRDYNLGNYLRAQEFFQVVLNLDSDNQLAKRHLYLSQVRFDELVQTKLMLGESYYSKHNFSMCLSMYQQVVNMLENKKSDSKYRLAERKAKECELALEGIR